MNRDKFDLVTVCDESSESTNDSLALTMLVRAIYENEFKKSLRNIPIILVGGIRAWESEFGGEEMTRGGTESSTEATSLSPNGLQSFGASSTLSGLISPRFNGMMAPMMPLPSPSLVSSLTSPHMRTPAESSASAHFSSSFVDSSNFSGRSRSGTEPTAEANGYQTWVPPPGSGTPEMLHQIPSSLRYVEILNNQCMWILSMLF